RAAHVRHLAPSLAAAGATGGRSVGRLYRGRHRPRRPPLRAVALSAAALPRLLRDRERIAALRGLARERARRQTAATRPGRARARRDCRVVDRRHRRQRRVPALRGTGVGDLVHRTDEPLAGAERDRLRAVRGRLAGAGDGAVTLRSRLTLLFLAAVEVTFFCAV